MKVAFISNFINHHQVHVADELYKVLGEDYKFIETELMPDSFVKNGYPDYSNKAYVIKAHMSSSLYDYAIRFAYEADVVVIGSAPECFVTRRIEDGKLTFRYSERWFKSRPWFLTGPRGWLNIYKNHIRYKNKPLYMLCASAFTSKDVNTVGAYNNKCFKWGYFTKVYDWSKPCRDEVNTSENRMSIMWCARFIKLKHPELPIRLAERLKKRGYKFIIDMYGSGEELERTKLLASQLNVADCVNFKGNSPNDIILEEMRRHDIFLFTSDRNEGWGAVVNEAMSCGCAVVGSDEIGSIPFLIEDGKNGLVFKSGNLKSLEEKVCLLMNEPLLLKRISEQARKTMKDVWSPENAARQFLKLIQAMLFDTDFYISEKGPCSKA